MKKKNPKEAEAKSVFPDLAFRVEEPAEGFKFAYARFDLNGEQYDLSHPITAECTEDEAKDALIEEVHRKIDAVETKATTTKKKKA